MIPASAVAPMILLYGTDPMLLQTRARILELSGQKTICAMRAAEFRRFLSSEHPEAVLLCHTIPCGEQNQMLRAIAETHPESRCLVLTGNGEAADVTMKVRGDVVSGFVSPRKLLQHVDRLIDTHRTGYTLDYKWRGFLRR